MNPTPAIRSEDCKYVIKSCRNLVQTEIRTLRENIDSLRGFLRGCQDTINSETSKLEKKCLSKIQSLDNERLRLERDLSKATNDKNRLTSLKRESDDRVIQLEDEVFRCERTKSELDARVAFLESQLSTKNDLCKELREKLEEVKMRCLALENKLATNESYVQEQKEVLHEVISDQKQLESSTADLKLRAAESEVYEKALEGHVSELEAICSILREQHDEQQKYFLRKEASFKREAQDQYRGLEKENKHLSDQISELKAEVMNERLRYSQQAELSGEIKTRLKEKESVVENLTERLGLAKNDIQMERSTVASITQKNHDLSQKILRLQSKLNDLEEKVLRSPSKDETKPESVERKTLTEIENTIQRYAEGSLRMSKKLENYLLVSNDDKLEECERQLAYERKKRLSAEMEAANLSVELEKAKVELAIYRCNASNHKNGSYYHRGKKMQNGNWISFSSNDLNAKCDKPGKCNQEYSELLSNVPNAAKDPTNVTEFSTQECNIFNAASLTANGEHYGELTTDETSNHSGRSSTTEFASGNEISVSRRASEKMEEAARRALAMLHNK